MIHIFVRHIWCRVDVLTRCQHCPPQHLSGIEHFLLLSQEICPNWSLKINNMVNNQWKEQTNRESCWEKEGKCIAWCFSAMSHEGSCMKALGPSQIPAPNAFPLSHGSIQGVPDSNTFCFLPKSPVVAPNDAVCSVFYRENTNYLQIGMWKWYLRLGLGDGMRTRRVWINFL